MQIPQSTPRDNPNASPSQRLRAYFNDYETKTVHDLLIKHRAAVKNYTTLKSRLASGFSIHDAVTTVPKKTDGVEDCLELVSDLLNKNIGKWFTVAQIAKDCGIIMLSAGRAYDVISKFECSQTMLKGSKKMIKIVEYIDLEEENEGNLKLNFVDKAIHTPLINNKSINPNWFITKKLH